MKKDRIQSPIRRENSHIIHHLQPFGNIVLPLFSVLLILLVFSSCSSCSGGGKYDFRTRHDAINEYHQYLRKVRSISHSNTKDFGETLCEWHEINDTVYKFLANDSVFSKHHNEANDFFLIHDSIRTEMLRLTETWKYGYGDVLAIKDMTCSYKEDGELLDAVHKAEPFFNAMDSTSISICDKGSILKRYRYFLNETKKSRVNNKDELLKFTHKASSQRSSPTSPKTLKQSVGIYSWQPRTARFLPRTWWFICQCVQLGGYCRTLRNVLRISTALK